MKFDIYFLGLRQEIVFGVITDIEDITWPRGDTKFLFECWKIFHEWAQWTSEIFFQYEKINLYLQAAMYYSIYYINTNELPNHFTLIVFWCERRDLLCSHSNGDIFTCEDNMLFSHVKIPSFRAKVHLVFHWCLCILINLITSIALEKCKKNAKLFKSFWYKVFVH